MAEINAGIRAGVLVSSSLATKIKPASMPDYSEKASGDHRFHGHLCLPGGSLPG
jgi:hypothetical protein